MSTPTRGYALGQDGGPSLCLEPKKEGISETYRARDGGISLAAGGPVLVLGDGRDAAAARDLVREVSRSEGSPGLSVLVRREDFELRSEYLPSPDANGFDIVTSLGARRRLELLSFGHRYEFPPGRDRRRGAPLDFAWIPSLKSSARDLAGEHSFRSPCVILRQERAFAALLPRIGPGYGREAGDRASGDVAGGPAAPRALDLVLCRAGKDAPRFEYRFQCHAPHDHVYYAPTGRAIVLEPGERLEISFTLLLDDEAGEFAYRAVLRLIWERCSAVAMASGLGAQALRFEDYARRAYRNLFEGYRLWRDRGAVGSGLGGIPVRVARPNLDLGSAPLPHDQTPAIARSYLFSPTMRLRDKLAMAEANARGMGEHHWNGIFFNQVRTAFGMEYYGRLWSDAALRGRARAMRELALSAPSASGIFPSVYVPDPKEPIWIPGTRVWRYTGAYHVPDAAWTGLWMLRTFEHLDPDPRLIARCTALGAFLLRAQLPSGAIPSWVRIGRDGRPRPAGPLAESAASSAAGMFLAALAEATGEASFREAAARVAAFIVREVFPLQAWQDVEVFFSCSPKGIGWKDPATGILPQGSLCLSWTAELFRALARSTGEERYVAYGRAALDLLLLYQQVWSPPFIGFDARGGFGAINSDAEWSDARQAQFANLLMDWYGLTGERELFLRGAAALKASFALMYLPEHIVSAPGKVLGPRPEDEGAIPENYGHAGLDRRIQGYIFPDWGAGSATSSAALARILYGELYVDLDRGEAFGLDGCALRRAGIEAGLIDLDIDRLGKAPILLKTGSARKRIEGGLELRVNGRSMGGFTPAALEAGVEI